MELIQNILYDMIYHSTPVILLVIGGVFAYKVNVLNISLEGMLLFGAFSSALIILMTGDLFYGLLGAILSNLIIGLLFSYFSITRKGNFIVIGIAINMLTLALAAFILKVKKMAIINISSIVKVSDLKIHLPIIKDIPFVGQIVSEHPLMTYLSFILILILSVVMFKTKFGTYVRVIGENEEAAKSIGIKVNYIKYLAILIGAMTSAFAGYNLAVERLALYTNGMSSGRGFIAIAAIYCGRGKPTLSAIYAIIFGLAKALAINLKLFAGPISGLFEVMPYIIMVIVLMISSFIENKNTMKRGYAHE